jgi:riboflavin kinase/FMN adenylyltransferase
MIISTTLDTNKGLAIALGYFDGMHLGHRKLISTLVKAAKEKNLKTAVITFKENPANSFNDEPVLNIQIQKDKERILEDLGIDYLYELDFEEYKNMLAIEYIQDVLVKNFEPKIIVVGYNHTLGADTKTCDFIKENESKFNYSTIIVPQFLYNGTEKVSSSIIRKHIEKGHLNATNILLGKNFSVINSVVNGDKIATGLGYPTANLVWPDDIVKLPYGVYFGYAKYSYDTIPALISWGVKPTLSSKKEEKLEAHLYDFDKNIYGRILRIIFVKKYRDEIQFENLKVLKEQLADDYATFAQWARPKSLK